MTTTDERGSPLAVAPTAELGLVPERTTGELLMALAVVRELTGTQHADLDATIDSVRDRFKWISVNERLPEKNIEVFIAFAGQCALASTGQYTGNRHDAAGWCYPAENAGCPWESDPVVTHWMPMFDVPQKA